MLTSRKSLIQLKCYTDGEQSTLDESPLPPVPFNSMCDDINGKLHDISKKIYWEFN